MVSLALGVLCLAGILAGAALLGGLLLPARLCRGAVDRFALGGPLGLLLLGTLDFLLRLAGWRLPPALAVLLIAGSLLILVWRRAGTNDRAAKGHPGGRRQWAPLARLALLLVIGGAPLLLLALYPAVDPDPGIYHLPFARRFAAGNGLPFLADLRFPVFPLLSELDFAFGLRLAGTTGVHLIEVALALWTALLLWVWGRDLGGETAGLCAAALWLGNPLVILLGTTAHVDVGLAAFVLAGLLCLERARTDQRSAWPLLAGAFLGGAAAIKYLGLLFLAVGGVAVALRRRAADAGRFALGAAVVALPLYLHILATTGNPIFPFYPQVFGYTEWTHDRNLRPEQVQPIPVAWTGATVHALLSLPRERLAAILHHGPGTLGALVRAVRDPPHIRLLRLPWVAALALIAGFAALVRGLGRAALRLPLAAALLSLLLWLSTLEDVQRLDPRYILAAAPPIALAIGAAAAELGERIARWAARRRPAPDSPLAARAAPFTLRGWPATAAMILALLLVLPGASYARRRCEVLGPLPFSREARLAVLRARLPAFAALESLARTRDSAATSVYGFLLEDHRFYAPGGYLGDWFGPARYAKLDRAFASGESLYTVLRQLGADHFLALRPRLDVLPRDPTFAAHFHREYEDAAAILWKLQP